MTDAQTCLCGRGQNSKCARENILKKCFASRSPNLRLFEFEFRLEVLTREKRQSIQSLSPYTLNAEMLMVTRVKKSVSFSLDESSLKNCLSLRKFTNNLREILGQLGSVKTNLKA